MLSFEDSKGHYTLHVFSCFRMNFFRFLCFRIILIAILGCKNDVKTQKREKLVKIWQSGFHWFQSNRFKQEKKFLALTADWTYDLSVLSLLPFHLSHMSSKQISWLVHKTTADWLLLKLKAKNWLITHVYAKTCLI